MLQSAPTLGQDLVHYYGQWVKMLPKELQIEVYALNDGNSKGIIE